MTVGKTIQQELKKLNKNVVWLSEQTGIPKTTIYSMIKKENDNTLDNLALISEVLHVSTDYLLKDLKKTQSPCGSLSPIEEQLLSTFRSLNEEGQEKLLEQAEFFASSGKYIKNHESEVV